MTEGLLGHDPACVVPYANPQARADGCTTCMIIRGVRAELEGRIDSLSREIVALRERNAILVSEAAELETKLECCRKHLPTGGWFL